MEYNLKFKVNKFCDTERAGYEFYFIQNVEGEYFEIHPDGIWFAGTEDTEPELWALAKTYGLPIFPDAEDLEYYRLIEEERKKENL